MYKCAICPFEVEKRKGLLMHVKMKHGIASVDYIKQYGELVDTKPAVKPLDIGDKKDQKLEEPESEDNNMSILDWTLFPGDYHFYASYLDDKGKFGLFKRIVGIGKVRMENNDVVLLSLILDSYGSLYPASLFPNFDRIIEEAPQKPSTGIAPAKKKRKITIKNPFAKKKRSIYGEYVPGLKSTDQINQELLQRLSKYEDIKIEEE